MEIRYYILFLGILVFSFGVSLLTAILLSGDNYEIEHRELSDDLIAYYGGVCDLYNASDDCYLQTNGTRINCSELTKVCAGDEE